MAPAPTPQPSGQGKQLSIACQIAHLSMAGHSELPFHGNHFEHMLQNSPATSCQGGAIQDASNLLNHFLLNPWSQEAQAFQVAMGVAQKKEICEKSTKHCNRCRKRGNPAQCSVTERWGDCNTVVGAHLLPVGTTTANIQIALNMVGKLNDPRNVIGPSATEND